MPARATLIDTVGTAGTGAAVIAATQKALVTRPDLTMWFDVANGATRDATGYIEKIESHKLAADGSVITLMPPSPSNAGVFYNTTDGRKGLRSNYDITGATANPRGTMVGSANALIPPTPFVISMIARLEAASAVTAMFGSHSYPDQFHLLYTSAGGIRFYSDYTEGTLLQAVGDPAWLDVPALWTLTHDGTTATVYRNGTSVLTGTAALPNPLTSRIIRVGSTMTDAGVDLTSPLRGYWEQLWVGNAISAGLLAAIKAETQRLHPSWSIA